MQERDRWGNGCWGTKTVKGKKYIRYRKMIGLDSRIQAEVTGTTERECLRKMKEKERELLEQESTRTSSSLPSRNMNPQSICLSKHFYPIFTVIPL